MRVLHVGAPGVFIQGLADGEYNRHVHVRLVNHCVRFRVLRSSVIFSLDATMSERQAFGLHFKTCELENEARPSD